MRFRHPCAALATVAIGLSLAGGALAKTRHEAPEAERMWRQFLAEARTQNVYGAFDVLDAVGYEGDAVDLRASGDIQAIRWALDGLPDVDVFVQPEENRFKRLLVADMDSTIVGQEFTRNWNEPETCEKA